MRRNYVNNPEEDVCERCCNHNLFASNPYIKQDNREMNHSNDRYNELREIRKKQNISNDHCSFSNNSTVITQKEISNMNNINYNPEDMKYVSPISSNYINEIRSMYDKDKENLQEKLFSLSKEFDSTKYMLTDQISSMQNKLLDQEKKSNSEMKMLNNQHSCELKRSLADKDSQIKILINKNNELTKCNEALLAKMDLYLDTINDTKVSLSARVSNFQSESDHLKQELQRMKDYYEKKVIFINSEHENEKNKLIYSHNNSMEKLKHDSQAEKEKLQKIIEEKDKDLKTVNESYKKEQSKFVDFNSEFKKQLDQLTEERAILLQTNEDQKANIEKLYTDLKQSKKETKAVLGEKLKYQGQSGQLSRENENLKIYNDKLNRLTHGKIKK